MLLAGFVFLHFMGVIRSVLGTAESQARGSQLAPVALGGALTGVAGMATASAMLAAASSNGADVDPVVSKAVATASGGPFLIAAMGFAAFLMAAGLLTLRTSLRTLDRDRRGHRRGVFRRDVPDSARRDDRRQRVRLRVLPGHLVARRMDSGNERCHLSRAGDRSRLSGIKLRRQSRIGTSNSAPQAADKLTRGAVGAGAPTGLQNQYGVVARR